MDAAYEYDAANNPTKIGSNTYKYNEADELESATGFTYTYNEDGQRTKTTPTTGPATTYEAEVETNPTLLRALPTVLTSDQAVIDRIDAILARHRCERQ